MKFKVLLFAAALTGSSLAFAQSGPPEGKALVGDTYGSQVTSSAESKAITVDKLNEQLKKDRKRKKIETMHSNFYFIVIVSFLIEKFISCCIFLIY